MPSELVDSIRTLLRARREEGRILTAAERAVILAHLGRFDPSAGMDAVDELEAAIANARRVCLSEPATGTPRDVVDKHRADAVRRLLAAARGVLDYTPEPGTPTLEVPEPLPEELRPAYRADLDS